MKKEKKKYQKPETEIELLSSSESVMQVIETSPGTGNVDPDHPVDPNEPELTNRTSLWDEYDAEGTDN